MTQLSSLHRKDVTVAGAGGYVGLISALEFARLGRTVWCVDTEGRKIELLKARTPPFVEDDLEDLLCEMTDLDRLRFATSYEDAIPASGFVVIALPTPSPEGTDLAYDMEPIYECVDTMVDCGLGSEHALVMKSTVRCGTGAEITRRLAKRNRHVPYVACPEFLREGSALRDAETPDRIIIGHAGSAAGRALAEVFRGIGEGGRKVAEGIRFEALREIGIESAELVKLASNGWLASQICVINEIANLCDTDALRADVVEVAEQMACRELPLAFLRAGIGFAGPCFPKDVHGLRGVAIEADLPFELLDVVLAVNRKQPSQAVRKARLALRTLNGKTIALLGASFKAGTSDTRHSMAVELILRLVAEGAEVVVFDPEAKRFEAEEKERLPATGWRFVESEDDDAAVDECLRAADLAMIATDWGQFEQIDWRSHGTRVQGVVDGRNIIAPRSVTDAGLSYDGIGRRVMDREPATRLQGRDLTEFAETARLATLAIKRSFMAEMAAIADRVGASWPEVAEGIALDTRIGPECVSEQAIDPARLDAALEEILELAGDAGYRFATAAQAARTSARI
jgi:UDPglucose 6-dehydrogenase